MPLRRPRPPSTGGVAASLAHALAIATLVSLTACGGSPSPPNPPGNPPGGPPSNPPDPPPGVITIRGTELIEWDQRGNVAELRFLMYVDDQRTPLDRAACAAGGQASICRSPLPPLADGLHTIELAAASNLTQLESVRSTALRVQKVAAITSGASTLTTQSYAGTANRRTVDNTVTTGDGLVFDVLIVAQGLDSPSQMAWAPDGRLFIADAIGRVLVLPSAGAPASGPTPALDAGGLGLASEGGLGLALHPEFRSNHFVYVASVARGRFEQPMLQVVRLREVGGTLGEPAVLFEEELASEPRESPRLAFGPDRRLYIALASSGVLLQIAGDGPLAGESPVVSSAQAQLVGFDWLPGMPAPWVVIAGADHRATLRQIGATPAGDAAAPIHRRPVDVGVAETSGALHFYRKASRAGEPTALVALPENESLVLVRVGRPRRTEVLLSGALGRIGDIIEAEAGVLFVSTRNRDGRGVVGPDDDRVLRLTPRNVERERPPGTK